MNLYFLQVVVILAALFGAYSAGKIDFSDCGSDYRILSVELEGCDIIPCKLQQGSSYKIEITLKPSYKSSYLTQTVNVELSDVYFKLDVTPDNPCASLSCPITTSTHTKLTSTITIGKDLLTTTGTLWWIMKTEKQRVAVCMKTVVEIVRKPYKEYKISKLLLL